MSPKDAERLSYDPSTKTVRGENFEITYAGESPRETIRTIFYYKDDSIDFYFSAIRKVWTEPPGGKLSPAIRDTGIYDIRDMWCSSTGCVHRKSNLPKESKERAKKNILTGLMLMEGNERNPPTHVVITSE